MINTIQHALQGLAGATRKAETAAANIAQSGTATADPSHADPSDPAYEISLSEEAVRLIEAETAFKANASVLKTAAAMQDELLSSLNRKA